MAGVIRLQSSLLKRIIPNVSSRLISTLKKNSDTATVSTDTKAEHTTTSSKNWVSYGFEKHSESDDRQNMHAIFFSSVTLCLVVGAFILAYAPDHNLRNWAQREAFLELRRREQNGQPLVDPNLIDPSKVILPSDEELGDAEIII